MKEIEIWKAEQNAFVWRRDCARIAKQKQLEEEETDTEVTDAADALEGESAT